MSSGLDWRQNVSFSRRLENVSKLSQAIQKTNGSAPAKALYQQATEIEQAIHRDSCSEGDYSSSCLHAIQELDKAAAKNAGEVPAQQNSSSSAVDDAEKTPWADSKLLPGAVNIGRYKNARYYRDGLFSTVYKAPGLADNSSGESRPKFVALKVTTPAVMIEPHDSSREARILQSLDHPHIIPLLDVFQQAGGRLVLAFPFMDTDLQAVLSTKTATQAQLRDYLQDLFKALAYLHSHGLIHRDIKPSNVLLKGTQGPAYLADFGIAWSRDDAGSEPYDKKITDIGTTCYRPPELLFGQRKYDCTLDLWAAGCVVAEANSSGPLFDAGDLGSELALIYSIFHQLGTPTTKTWPEAANFPDWGKMNFQDYPTKPWDELLPRASREARDLVGKLVRFQSTDRLSASLVLKHSYFEETPN